MWSFTFVQLFVIIMVVQIQPATTTTIRVVDGFITTKDGEKSFVGTYTSLIQQNVLANLCPKGTPNENISFFNVSNLNYLILEGNYEMDKTLAINSMCIITLNGKLTVASNASAIDPLTATGIPSDGGYC
eukprot:m.166813 g.166813  ORF g.166813 m.166813 type:complete len:130 (+) comp15294_c0_seq2:72-461(+)